MPIRYRDPKLRRIQQAWPRSARACRRIAFPTVPCHAVPCRAVPGRAVPRMVGFAGFARWRLEDGHGHNYGSYIARRKAPMPGAFCDCCVVCVCVARFNVPSLPDGLRRLRLKSASFCLRRRPRLCDAMRFDKHRIALQTPRRSNLICNKDTARQPAGRSARDRAGECGLRSNAKRRRSHN